ncbi:MAG TPA: hypothetical protein VIV60_03495 [Polyangiaceae bacterium]
MRQTQRAACAVLLATAVIGVVGVGCRSGTTDQGLESSPALWTAEQPFQVVDNSLSLGAYRSRGIAAVDRTWSGGDMVEAAAKLRQLVNREPGRLPRSGSPRSGALFGRMTSADNLTSLQDPSLPVAIRLPSAIEFMGGLDALFTLYLTEMQEQRVSGADIVELDGARLRTIEVVIALLETSLAEQRRDEPTRANRLAAFDRVRQGLYEVLSGILGSIADPRQLGVSSRRRLVGYCLQSLPRLAPKLEVKARSDLLELIARQSRDPHLENLRQQLSQLRDAVSGSVLATELR